MGSSEMLTSKTITNDDRHVERLHPFDLKVPNLTNLTNPFRLSVDWRERVEAPRVNDDSAIQYGKCA
jgi:hypothetical protein